MSYALSRTGLLPSITEPKRRKCTKRKIEFRDIVKPAPYVQRPFSEYYNPFFNNCSILCNHPVDQEIKHFVKKVKETRVLEYKGICIDKIHLQDEDDDIMVPEDLFRRYTETDSRPQTPALTMRSAVTQKSNYRRCITPDPPNRQSEKTPLVLDLRRSLSQDMISDNIAGTLLISKPFSTKTMLTEGKKTQEVIQGKIPKQVKPINIQCSRYNEKTTSKNQYIKPKLKEKEIVELLPSSLLSLENAQTSPSKTTANQVDDSINEKECHKKKKKKKSKGKEKSRNVGKEFKGLAEPGETQISSHIIESPISGNTLDLDEARDNISDIVEDDTAQSTSKIEADLLKDLKRELDAEAIDNEFNPRRRKILEEVWSLNLLPRKSSVIVNEEIRKLKEELKLIAGSPNIEAVLKLPRTFSRRNARFELPMDRTILNDIKPLEYVQSYCIITCSSRLVYNKVFNSHLDNELIQKRIIPTTLLIQALSQIMGHNFGDEKSKIFIQLLQCPDNGFINFRTWCGICALCERILGPELTSIYPTREEDPCYEIEMADFEALPRRLYGLKPDANLVTILYKIRDM